MTKEVTKRQIFQERLVLIRIDDGLAIVRIFAHLNQQITMPFRSIGKATINLLRNDRKIFSIPL